MPGIAAIGQDIDDVAQRLFVHGERLQCAFSIRDLRRRDRDRMGQALDIYRNMTLDAGYFLARVIPFLFCGVGVFHALRINNHEAGLRAPSMADAGLDNRIFLMPAQAGSGRLRSASLSRA